MAQPRLAFLLSAANMRPSSCTGPGAHLPDRSTTRPHGVSRRRLKLHEPELAASLYRHVAEHADASDAEREMAARKLRDAEAEGEARRAEAVGLSSSPFPQAF